MIKLGQYPFPYENVRIFDSCLDLLKTKQHASFLTQLDLLFTAVVKIIQSTEGPTFLLPPLMQLFEQANRLGIFSRPLRFYLFEFWLNQFSGLSLEEQLSIRNKVAGKNLPREAYQVFFPIGMEKFYRGTHFITAHLSPDLDTITASFIGWIDAFGSKVATGLHIWSVPGGSYEKSTEQLFTKVWGGNVFESLARPDPTLTLNAIDLLTQEGIQKVSGNLSMIQVDPGLHEKAILLIDSEGRFLGDWHSRDAERIRPILFLFKTLMRESEGVLFTKILRFFAGSHTQLSDWQKAMQESFQTPFITSGTCQELMSDEKEHLHLFLKEIMHVPKGLTGNLQDLSKALKQEHLTAWSSLIELIDNPPIFTEKGNLKEDRPLIFQTIENLISSLNQAFSEADIYSERLKSAILLKSLLRTSSGAALTIDSSIEEIRSKMEGQDYLPVLLENGNQESVPLGIITRQSLLKIPLGTVSLRDFSNFDEMHMASYLNVISIIDHHKSSFQTATPSLILVGDVQSCNTLIAEQLLQLNDKYPEKIAKERLIAEYFSCLYAIIDDTDFLSKVSSRDVDCTVALLNQLKWLISSRKDSISLEGIPRDEHFSKTAAKYILANGDMFSIYDGIIQKREEQVEKALQEITADGLNFLLIDTKEQNGCTRIGQSKLFPVNFTLFEEKKAYFQKAWSHKARQVFDASSEITLHLQMISTIPSSQALFKGEEEKQTHLDELWIWIPSFSAHGKELLTTFLNAFQDSPGIREKAVKIGFAGDQPETLERIFQHNFFPIPSEREPRILEESIAILYIAAGTLNSRKSMVSPYLPKRVS